MHQKNERITILFFASLFGLALVLNFLIFRPYILLLFLAVVLAVIFYPLYLKLLHTTFNSKIFAAFATTLILLAVLVAPLAIIGILVFQELRGLYGQLELGPSRENLRFLENYLQYIAPDFSMELSMEQYTEQALTWFAQKLNLILARLAHSLLGLVIFLLAFFYTLKDGLAAKEWILKNNPISRERGQEILDTLAATIKAVVRGTLFLAFVRLILIAPLFMVLGIPGPILWSVIGSALGIIPGIGTIVIIAPAVVYLVLTGSTINAALMAIIGTIYVFFIDNIIGPKLIENRMKVHPFLILASILGGLMVLGPIGFLVGPVFLSLLLALFKTYPLIVQDLENSTQPKPAENKK